MKILFVASAFNSMTQRAWVELDRLDHQVKVHIVSTDKAMMDAVEAYTPDLMVATYLKTPIPSSVWKKYTCLIIHPGIAGDRGSSSLDWAILNEEKEWGVTIIEAVEKMDAGPVWATVNFPMRDCSKSALYRHEVTQAAMEALLKAVLLFEKNQFCATNSLDESNANLGKWRRSANENDFKFSWSESTASILKKIKAGDSYPGARCTIFDDEYSCYGAFEEKIMSGPNGDVIAKSNESVCIATSHGAIWLQCLKDTTENSLKLPASKVLGHQLKDIPEYNPGSIVNADYAHRFHDIWYEESDHVGYLHFDFYNGAMSTVQCKRLLDAFIAAKARSTKVIVLMGGADIWSNGIHLNLIEASNDPAQASWENINAINDLIREIICTESHYVISALQGNAGAGGVALALAADKVLAKKGIVFNPHTRKMGLYGSEYWTYLFPRRIGTQRAEQFTEQCLPWGTDIAMEVKLIDDCFNLSAEAFQQRIKVAADEIAHLSYFDQLLAAKKFKRKRDESYKLLQEYREEELEKMQTNFFENDWGYDFLRYCFVHKLNPEENNDMANKDLFSERRKIWRRRKYEKLFYEV